MAWQPLVDDGDDQGCCVPQRESRCAPRVGRDETRSGDTPRPPCHATSRAAAGPRTRGTSRGGSTMRRAGTRRRPTPGVRDAPPRGRCPRARFPSRASWVPSQPTPACARARLRNRSRQCRWRQNAASSDALPAARGSRTPPSDRCSQEQPPNLTIAEHARAGALEADTSALQDDAVTGQPEPGTRVLFNQQDGSA